MKGLRLGDGLTLPLDAATDTFAIVGMRGAGKSATGRRMAEQMYANGLPFVAVDPVGKWFGLRSSADGKAPGIAIPILGGRHGDIPLERDAGALVADLIVDQRLSCILDLWLFETVADKVHFLTEFCKRLYRRNEEPLHLFLEEADDYIPQNIYAEKARLFRAFEDVVRRGRANGLGCTMITNRTQGLNKAVLEMTGTMIAMRTTGPRARHVIEDWFEYHDLKKEALASLPSLADGEAWVWSPESLKIMKRVQIDMPWTFDSGATPKVGAKSQRKASTLADVDLAAFQVKMSQTIERAKAEDPKELKRRVADLERLVAEAKRSKPVVAPVEVRIPVPVLDDGVTQEIAGVVQAAKDVASKLHDHGALLRSVAEDLANSAEAYMRGATYIQQKVDQALKGIQAASIPVPRQTGRPPGRPEAVRLSAHLKNRSVENETRGALRYGERRMLQALLRYHPKSLSRSEIGMLAGISRKGGTFSTYLGVLKAKRLIDEADGYVYATHDALGMEDRSISIPQDAEGLMNLWSREVGGRNRLRQGERAMLHSLVDVHPKGMTRGELGDRAGIARQGGTFSTYLGRLKSFYLVVEEGGFVKANLEIFR
jgi:uncharacterized protein